MAKVISQKQLEIFECHTDDGGVGIRIGSGPVFLGYDGQDLFSLLAAVFPNADDGDPLDGDLLSIAEQYLDEDDAARRREWLCDGMPGVDDVSLREAEEQQEWRETMLYDGLDVYKPYNA